jgi:2-polyprenyl-3-methyl-5-hydroxy-6-metoxy-1,4-benzoquinol methylase
MPMSQKQHWNQIYSNGRKFSEVSEIVLDQVLPTKVGTVLDIGCGIGELMRQLKARGFKPTGIDLSDVATKEAKLFDPEMIYSTGDFIKTEFGKFDVIVANKVVAFNNLDVFIKKVTSILSDSGIFILITPVTYKKYGDEYSDRLKSISVDFDELNTILGKYFTNIHVVDKRYFENYGCELTIKASR